MAKKFKKDKNEFSDKEVLSVVSPDTRKLIKIKRMKIKTLSKGNSVVKKYSSKEPRVVESFVAGYDLLQYSIAVRPFIMRKYNIKKTIELEVLLYLFPIQYFTRGDFAKIPGVVNSGYGLSTLVDLGYLKIAVQTVSYNARLFQFTDLAIKIVKEYYAYLSGEKHIQLNSIHNPFKGAKAQGVNLQRQKLLMDLKRRAENKPNRLKKSLYSFD